MDPPNECCKGQYHKSLYEDLHCIWATVQVQRAVNDKTAKRTQYLNKFK